MTADGENECHQRTMLPTFPSKSPTNVYDDGMAEAQKTRSAHGQRNKKTPTGCATSALWNLRLHRSTYISNNSIIVRSEPMGEFTNHTILSLQVDPVNLSRYVIYSLPIIHDFGCLIYQLSIALAVSSISSSHRLLQRHSHICPCRWTVKETQSFRQMVEHMGPHKNENATTQASTGHERRTAYDTAYSFLGYREIIMTLSCISLHRIPRILGSFGLESNNYWYMLHTCTHTYVHIPKTHSYAILYYVPHLFCFKCNPK
ncbi:uncharacterized protein Bfra_004988 [Botrytis fragariae]|uniref:Uncharacterized protein n=1 Tax=Botrytis fragariae TaxID=1964551 RepID=A0A8H6EIJ4_9HELO|nr:uncharacterized protein Bfra_004988 [Botrytis fragariae]KAF5873526.1 hypothetical protein Bfra_004988 [Botrytis fragariae]